MDREQNREEMLEELELLALKRLRDVLRGDSYGEENSVEAAQVALDHVQANWHRESSVGALGTDGSEEKSPAGQPAS